MDVNEKIAENIAKELNNLSFREYPVIKAMTKQHRTLQQRFTRLCVTWLRVCGSDDYSYDERNEASHKLGQKLTPYLQDASLPFI